MDSIRDAGGRLTGALLLALLMVGTVAVLNSTANAAANDEAFVPHTSLVPDSPENGFPILLDTPTYIEVNGNCPAGCEARRQTYAVDMIGDYIISGGDFMNIELQDGTVVAQPYLAIVDSTTKQLVCTDLDVSNEVLAIAPGPEPKTAIIGGRFTWVNGADGVQRFKTRLAMIHLDTCEVNRNWSGGYVNSRVTELATSGNRLFVGGDFTQIAGSPIERLAEVNHTTGALNPSFSFAFNGELNRTIVGLEASPDGSRLGIVHRATSINGINLRGSAIFDISNAAAPTLTGHRLNTSTKAFTNYYDIQDGAFDPSFTRIGIAQGTATVSDYVTLLPTTETAGQFTWVKFMRDSSFSIALSNNAVYVAGHFCKIDSGPGTTALMAPNSGPSTCTGSSFFGGGVWRTQLAALSLSNGTPLEWNPGNDAFRGGSAITVVNRGLLVGFDGDRTDNIRTGTTAFFDFGAPDDPRTNQTCTASVEEATGLVTLTWDLVEGGVDNDSYVVRRNSGWVASPGNVSTYVDAPPNGVHTYYIRTVLDGDQWNTECNPSVTVAPPPPPAQTCVATANLDGTTSLVWTAIVGENSYTVRRNGSWLATPGNTLSYVDTATGDDYSIRSKMAGVTTETTCSNEGEPPPPPPDQTCTAVPNADGSITLNWTEIAGENKYTVRRNGLWLANAGDVLTYTDAGASPGDTYVIRSKMNGIETNTACL